MFRNTILLIALGLFLLTGILVNVTESAAGISQIAATPTPKGTPKMSPTPTASPSPSPSISPLPSPDLTATPSPSPTLKPKGNQ